MYGCTTVTIFAVSLLVLSTGFTSAPLKDRSPQRKPRNCTENNLKITVKCPSKLKTDNHPSAQNQSSCCSCSIINSSHPSEICVPAAQQHVTMPSNANPKESGSSPECLIRIAAALSKSDCQLLRVCEGYNVQLQCDHNASCGDFVRWRATDGAMLDGKTLHLQTVQRKDGGTYTCEVANYLGKSRLTVDVKVEIKFAPVITVPNSSVFVTNEVEEMLECQSEANPRPAITWFQDNAPLSLSSLSTYTVSSDSVDCTTKSFVLFKSRNGSEDAALENFTCVAENELGRAATAFIVTTFSEELSDFVGTGGRRPFNVTGFIVGMLPPLLISFYIILKLGYRSRYAEERGEDDGFREEPFFISY